jgi:HK97 family phage portal protein
MRCAPVRACVLAISEAVSQLTLPVYAIGEDGAKSIDTSHPVHKLLNGEANPWTPAARLRRQLTLDACLAGDGFAYINRIDGRPVELLHLAQGRVTVTYDTATLEPHYAIDGKATPRQNLLHIMAPSIDGVSGASPVVHAREAIALALIMEEHAVRLFANGACPSGVLSFKNNVTPEGLMKAKAAWKAAHGGSNSGGTAVVDGDAEFTQLTINSVDSQFLELRKFAIEEICRVWRVPPVLAQEFGRATWSNSTEMTRMFHDYCLTAWFKAWEGEIRIKLFSPEERDLYLVEHDTDDLLLPDLATRAKAYKEMISSGVLNANEARELERRAPYTAGNTFHLALGRAGDNPGVAS